MFLSSLSHTSFFFPITFQSSLLVSVCVLGYGWKRLDFDIKISILLIDICQSTNNRLCPFYSWTFYTTNPGLDPPLFWTQTTQGPSQFEIAFIKPIVFSIQLHFLSNIKISFDMPVKWHVASCDSSVPSSHYLILY